jgi:3-hydroxyisobutyrate dehydrogenase-like beta-hydroxyacid dehydrogenase
MQLGFVGLGKMGGNMVHRIHRDSDHQVVAFDYNDAAVDAAEEHGAQGVRSLEDLVAALDAPRIVWLMVPAGDITQRAVDEISPCSSPATRSSTAATPTGTTTCAAPPSSTPRGSTTSTSAPRRRLGPGRSATA